MIFAESILTVHCKIYVLADDNAVKRILLNSADFVKENPNNVTNQACRELSEYFAGKRRSFSVAVSPDGTAFQKAVWEQLQKTEYGQTVSYGEIAERIENKKAFRAVGNANHNNPIPIIIPCHRVVKSNGKTGGYALGVGLKQKLLDFEKANV